MGPQPRSSKNGVRLEEWLLLFRYFLLSNSIFQQCFMISSKNKLSFTYFSLCTLSYWDATSPSHPPQKTTTLKKKIKIKTCPPPLIRPKIILLNNLFSHPLSCRHSLTITHNRICLVRVIDNNSSIVTNFLFQVSGGG